MFDPVLLSARFCFRMFSLSFPDRPVPRIDALSFFTFLRRCHYHLRTRLAYIYILLGTESATCVAMSLRRGRKRLTSVPESLSNWKRRSMKKMIREKRGRCCFRMPGMFQRSAGLSARSGNDRRRSQTRDMRKRCLSLDGQGTERANERTSKRSCIDEH